MAESKDTKSFFQAFASTAKDEAVKKFWDKAGSNIGSAVEAGLMAREKGQKFGTAFYQEYKSQKVEDLKDKIFGDSIFGRALRAGFEAKFGKPEKKEKLQDTVEKLESENIETLKRIEVVVTNISDNLYNIAGVLGAQLTSMKQTKEDLAERLKQEQIAKEEATLESKGQLTATKLPEKKKEGDKKDSSPFSMIKNLLGGVGSMISESLLGFSKILKAFSAGLLGILKSKKFLALAGIAAVGAAAYAAMKDKQGESKEETEGGAAAVPSDPVEALILKREEEKEALLDSLMNNPKYSNGVSFDPNSSNYPKEFQDIDKKYESMIRAAEEDTGAKPAETSEQRLQRLGVAATETAGGGRGSMIPAVVVPSEGPTEPTPVAQPAASVSLSAMTGEAGGAGNIPPPPAASSAVPTAPSTGSTLNQMSVNMEASQPKLPPLFTNVDNSSSSISSTEQGTRFKIPPPVANRGTLDSMSFFR